MRAALLVTLALAACSGRGGTASTHGAPPAAAPASPSPPADPTALSFAEGTRERELRNFCVANYKKVILCFDDEPFWNVLATIFFAKNPTLDDGTPARRQQWIGMRKDDFMGLRREQRFASDCEVSIRRSRWPAAATIERVDQARGASCPAFANAFATMMFVEGAFSEAR